MTVKIAVLAPMPKASVSVATSENDGFFASIRRPKRRSCKNVFIISSYLFTPERDHRIHLRRPSRRQIAGHERDDREQNRKSEERERVRRAHFKEQATHQLSQRQRDCQANAYSD